MNALSEQSLRDLGETRLGIAFLGVLAASLVSVVLSTILSVTIWAKPLPIYLNLQGGLILGIVPATLLVDLAIVLSLWITRGSRKVSFVAWAFCCLAIYISLFILSPKAETIRDIHDRQDAMLFLMAFPTFPLGLVAGLLMAYVGTLAKVLFRWDSTGRSAAFVFDSFSWLAFVIAGYIQWFKLLPIIAVGKSKV